MPICGIAVTSEARPIDALTLDAMVSGLALCENWRREQMAESEIGLGATSATISWGASTDNVGVTGYSVYWIY